MGKLKTKIIESVVPNFESLDSNDFMEMLNVIAENMGGVPNMGIYAEITGITQSEELVADVCDQYISVTTKQIEKPYKDLQPISNETDPFQLELDDLIGLKGASLSSELLSSLEEDELQDDEDEDEEDEDDEEDEEEGDED